MREKDYPVEVLELKGGPFLTYDATYLNRPL